MSEPAFDPQQSSFVEGDLDLGLVSGATAASDTVRIIEEGLHEVVIDVESETQALLVLSDAYYPGWTATVDDESVQIHPTNLLFRGVRVPGGRHRVTFRYRPRSFLAGSALTAGGLVALALLTWHALRHPPAGIRASARRTRAARSGAARATLVMSANGLGA